MELERYKISVIGHIKVENHTEYTIVIEKKDVSFSFSDRYSNLKALNDLMKKATNSNAFPKFPPRKFFGAEDEKFINKRQQELNNYFEIISNSPQFSNLPPLIKFIKEKKEKYGPASTKNIAQVKPNVQPKKDSEIIPPKETTKSVKKEEDDYNKIVIDFTSQFYDMNGYYDKEMTNENDNYVKFFNNNKIDSKENSTIVVAGNDKNFDFISQNEENIENIENQIKEKIENISNFYQSFDESYNTKGIVVPI
jgi:hypothetical protein